MRRIVPFERRAHAAYETALAGQAAVVPRVREYVQQPGGVGVARPPPFRRHVPSNRPLCFNRVAANGRELLPVDPAHEQREHPLAEFGELEFESEEPHMHALRQGVRGAARPFAAQQKTPERELHGTDARVPDVQQRVFPEEPLAVAPAAAYGAAAAAAGRPEPAAGGPEPAAGGHEPATGGTEPAAGRYEPPGRTQPATASGLDSAAASRAESPTNRAAAKTATRTVQAARAVEPATASGPASAAATINLTEPYSIERRFAKPPKKPPQKIPQTIVHFIL